MAYNDVQRFSSNGVLPQASRMLLSYHWERIERSQQLLWTVLALFLAFHDPAIASAQNVTADAAYQGLATLSQRLEKLEPLLNERKLASPDADLARLQQAYSELVSYLDVTADSANREAWLAYIDVPGEISGRTPATSGFPSAESINSLCHRLSRNVAGIEREPMIRFRQAARTLAARLTIWQRREREQIARAGLRRLSSVFADGNVPTGSAEIAELNRFLWYVEATGMLPEAADMIRHELGQPNVRVLVGENFLRETYRQPVSLDGPSDEWILGTRVLSDTSLRGNVSVELHPSNEVAQLKLVLDADFSSQGVGYNRGVKVFNEGRGHVVASRVLMLGDSGLSARPVQVLANLDTVIKGVSHPCNLVRKFASRKATQQKSAANSIARDRLVSRVRRQFQEETDSRLSQNDGDRLRSIDLLLRRLDVSPIERRWRTTQNALELTLRAASPSQVTTCNVPPVIEAPSRLVLQLHQSVIENTATEVLGQRTLSEKDFDEFARTLFASGLIPIRTQISAGEESEDPKETRSNRPLTIEFLRLSPVAFDVRDGEIRIAARGAFSTEGSRDRSLLEIAATYRFEKNVDGTPSLVRVGDSTVTFLDETGKPRRGLLLGGVANVVRQRALQLLPQTVPLPPLNWPHPSNQSNSLYGNSPMAINPAKRDQVPLYVEDLIAEDGWITVRFQ